MEHASSACEDQTAKFMTLKRKAANQELQQLTPAKMQSPDLHLLIAGTQLSP